MTDGFAAPLAASNPKIQRLRRLIGRRSSRREEGLLVLEGPHAIAAALSSGDIPVEAFIGEDAGPDLWEVFHDCHPAQHVVRAGVLEQVLSTQNPQPIVALTPWAPATLASVIERVCEGTVGPVLVLHEVRDPGNLGTVLRSAAGADAAGVVLTDGSVDPTNPKVVRASAGAVLHVPVVVDEAIGAVLDRLTTAGVRVLGTEAAEGTRYHDADLTGPVALLLGNEAHGVESDVLARCDGTITIPIDPVIESLNVAVAASVLLFESARQRATR